MLLYNEAFSKLRDLGCGVKINAETLKTPRHLYSSDESAHLFSVVLVALCVEVKGIP